MSYNIFCKQEYPSIPICNPYINYLYSPVEACHMLTGFYIAFNALFPAANHQSLPNHPFALPAACLHSTAHFRPKIAPYWQNLSLYSKNALLRSSFLAFCSKTSATFFPISLGLPSSFVTSSSFLPLRTSISMYSW